MSDVSSEGARESVTGPQLGRMQMDLPGLLALTSEALYSEPEVAFRELAQNAQDAIRRRRMAAPDGASAPEGRLVICCEDVAGRRYVTFEDNGAGLSADEAREFLATIGRGQTGRALHDATADGADNLIGRFGVGLLAAFMVADRVEVESRRFDLGPEQGVRWVNEGQQTYRIEAWSRRDAGTSVRLRMRETMAHMGTEVAVRGALDRWARYLDVPMQFASGAVLRAGVLPWRDGDAPEHVRAALESAIALEWGEVRATARVRLVPFLHEGRRVELHGLAMFAEQRSVAGKRGTTCIVVRRMVVERENPTLLPAWAGMARAIVECGEFLPTASRESVKRDALHDAVAAAVESQLLDGLSRLRSEHPEQFRALLLTHRDSFLENAGRHPQVFDLVADDMLLHTTDGPLTVPQCLTRGDGVIRYYRDGGDLETVSVLAAGRGWVVIDARHPAAIAFLTMSVRRRACPAQLFDPRVQTRTVLSASAGMERLRAWATSPSVRVELTELDPPVLPALVVEDWDAYHRRRAQDALERPVATTVVRDLLGDLAAPQAHATSTILLLNVRSPLIQRLAEVTDEARCRAALAALVMQARLLGERRPRGPETIALYEQLSAALEVLV